MSIFPGPLETVAANDISQLCADQISEGTELELKSDLPAKDGRLDSWHSGGSIGDYARNEIAEEIIAFANTAGGVVCIGIKETNDHPKRADAPHPLPRVHDLARRLRQSVYSIVDPPLPILESTGVELQSGSGVVLLRVPPSRRRPHRHQVNKEVFVRRNDESVRVSMREIQELTIQAVSEATRLETIISERRKKFREETLQWLRGAPGGGFHVVAVPTIPIDLGRVVGRPALTNFGPTITAHWPNGNQTQCVWPWRTSNWKPGLRSITGAGERLDSVVSCSLLTNGTCELDYKFKTSDRTPGLFIGWLIGALGFMLAWICRIQREAGISVEYACAIQLPIFGQAIAFVRHGATSFAEGDGSVLPDGIHEFPLVSVGLADELPIILQQFDEDLWNLAGYDIERHGPTFSLTPLA
jgi:hypothetical protein